MMVIMMVRMVVIMMVMMIVIEVPAPWVSSPSSHNSLLWRWYIGSAEDAFQDGNAAANDDVVGDILHDGSSFSGNQGEQYRSLKEKMRAFFSLMILYLFTL